MDLPYLLQQLGGCARRKELLRHGSPRDLARAVESGEIVRCGRGRYAVPGLDEAAREAHRLSGVISGRSAALFWNLSLRLAPGEVVRPTVTVPRNRRVARDRREGVDLKWRDLPPGAVVQGRVPELGLAAPGAVTSIAQTVLDCCRDLPEVDALCVVDAALRRGVPRALLLEQAAGLPRPVRSRVARVIGKGDGRAANAFESCLRHIALDVPGLDAVPQVAIGSFRVDLADRGLRMVIEAESFAFHGSKEMFRSDTRRYTWLTSRHWLVLRFVWEDVVLRPERARDDLIRAVACRRTCSPVQLCAG